MNSDPQTKILLRSYEAVVSLPIGTWQVGIRTDGRAVHEIDFIDSEEFERVTPSAVATEAAQQLQCYLDNPRWRFTIALKLHGTQFQQRVWAALKRYLPGKHAVTASWQNNSIVRREPWAVRVAPTR